MGARAEHLGLFSHAQHFVWALTLRLALPQTEQERNAGNITSVMAVHRLAQLRRKRAGVEVTVLSTEKSAGEYAGMT